MIASLRSFLLLTSAVWSAAALAAADPALVRRGGAAAELQPRQAASPTPTGFSTILKASPTAAAAAADDDKGIVEGAQQVASNVVSVYAEATGMPAHIYKEISDLSLSTKIAVSVMAGLVAVMLITLLCCCLRRGKSSSRHSPASEKAPMTPGQQGFEDRATKLPSKSIFSRRRSYRMFD